MLLWNKKTQHSLFDENTFYNAFITDLLHCKKETIIESPFITYSRVKMLAPVFKKLLKRNVRVYLITKDPDDLDEDAAYYAQRQLEFLYHMGVQVIICKDNHHRKLAIIDRTILYEGSLNILSQSDSREIMRRIESKRTAHEMIHFLNLGEFI